MDFIGADKASEFNGLNVVGAARLCVLASLCSYTGDFHGIDSVCRVCVVELRCRRIYLIFFFFSFNKTTAYSQYRILVDR